jgi:hypothetical protein
VDTGYRDLILAAIAFDVIRPKDDCGVKFFVTDTTGIDIKIVPLLGSLVFVG